MLRYSLRLIVVLTSVLLLPMLLIRAQPAADDSDLRMILAAPDDCPAPCFMGIRPGVTTAFEADDLLRNHEWAGRVIRPFGFGSSLFSGELPWEWSDTRPGHIIKSYRGFLTIEYGRVRALSFWTDIPIADFRLLLGEQDVQHLYISRREPPLVVHSLHYGDSGWQLAANIPCPIVSVWDAGDRSRVLLTLTARPRLEQDSATWLQVYNC